MDFAGTPPERLSELAAKITAPGMLFEVTEEEVLGQRMRVFKNRHRSLREFLGASRRFGTRTYLVDGDVRLDYATTLAQVDALASALRRDYGIQPGDRVAIYAANRWEWVVSFWAVASAGAIPAAFNSLWTRDEYIHAVNLTTPRLVIGDARRLEGARSSGLDTPLLDMVEFPGIVALHAGERPETVPVDEDDPALLIFTSGTTGRSKAVIISHRSACGFVQLNQFAEVRGMVLFGAPIPKVGDELPPSDDVTLTTAPLFHMTMVQGGIMALLAKGAELVLVPGRFDPERVLATIERERVTSWSPLGSAATRVANCPAIERYDTSSLRILGVGGAPVSPAVQDGLRRAFPSASALLGMGYTSTEGGAVIATISGPEFAQHPQSTGRITFTTQVELRDVDGRPVPAGQYGEVHVRSPYIMLGYWNDPEATAPAIKPGRWLAMGDIARFEDGLLYIDSRARDMILVSAENVSPTEVEYVLESHPRVVEAAVFAVNDDITGDAVCAVLSVGDMVTRDELTAWCSERLARYKVPTRWHIIQRPLPRTASGKLVKRELRLQVEKGVLA
ncbi:class I adenylate-forming enzyme family protein [Microtetraspora sp. NBRC 16547]|uniref:class I adenylate-forming enzyme family protein n=1 Tax=Microtetraspora sp. NBRC 16547 TaxID=3030993 RepID=UPI0024A5CA12|nr:class I adenylate-forming enzyme family protein [Microtetraspora sp. NBRC 16547]GLX02667.1 fatty acid--CoA ligase [Microtetraspora sp. NBRC 16547]